MTVVLVLRGIASEIVGAVAFVGLTSIWIYGRLRYRKIYNAAYNIELKRLEASNQEVTEKAVKAETQIVNEKFAASVSPSPLTHRQLEILTYIYKGCSNKQVAAKLNLSEQTIKNQLRNIFEKLDVVDRTQAVLKVIQKGWISTTDAFPIEHEANLEDKNASD